MNVPQLSIDEAAERVRDGRTVFVDVRDPDSYEESHLPGAVHVTDDNLEEFLASADKTVPVVVYCYHGNNSLGGAAYFLDQGFDEVYSMTGGFEAWRDQRLGG